MFLGLSRAGLGQRVDEDDAFRRFVPAIIAELVWEVRALLGRLRALLYPLGDVSDSHPFCNPIQI